MKIKPIDEHSDLSLVRLVIIRSMANGRRIEVRCKKHGAMNCNHVTKEGDRFYRCFSVYSRTKDRTCEAACILEKELG